MIPDKVFLAIAAGGGGASACAFLRKAQYGKRLLLLRGVRDAAQATAHAEHEQARAGYELLADLQQRHPREVDAVIRHPATGAWAQDTYMALQHGERAHPGGLAAVAAAAAVRTGAPRAIEVPVRDGAVVLPSLGRVSLPGHDSVVVRTGTGPAEVGEVRLPRDLHEDGPGWQPIRPVQAEHEGARLRLLVDDVDPHRLPDADLTPRRLTRAELARWRAAVHAGWELLVREHRGVAEEVASVITALAPMERAPDGHSVSATSPKAFGCVGLSTPQDAQFVAVTFAHEIQHVKLGALAELAPLTRPDDGRRFYAPWRDDPRPASGLLHGVFAHLGVAGFWRRQRQSESGESASRAATEFARWRESAAKAARTLLASGTLTERGRAFVAETERTLDSWLREPVPAEAASRARELSTAHLDRWRRSHGPLPPVQESLWPVR